MVGGKEGRGGGGWWRVGGLGGRWWVVECGWIGIGGVVVGGGVWVDWGDWLLTPRDGGLFVDRRMGWNGREGKGMAPHIDGHG
jgi:hypothetical protein